jgi:hypothetical protein
MDLALGALTNADSGTSFAVTLNGQSDEVLNRASLIEVSQSLGEETNFRIEYEVDIEDDDLPLLVDSRFDPGAELAIFAYSAEESACLVKGPVHAQEIHLQHGGAGSRMAVIGADRSVEMDRQTKTAIWADVTDSDVVSSILSGYGFIPDVESSPAGHYEDKHTLVQRESDLSIIRRLARRNGYHFWIDCDETGVETAHFRSPALDGEPPVSLTINADQPDIFSLDIVWDIERPTSVVSAQLDLNAIDQLDGEQEGSPLTVLGTRDLRSIAGDIRSIHLQAPADDSGDLQYRSRGLLIDASWFLQATCETSLHMQGKIVQAHSLVEIFGAGSRYSGRYYVAGVRHLIGPASHRMELTLIRNGWM